MNTPRQVQAEQPVLYSSETIAKENGRVVFNLQTGVRHRGFRVKSAVSEIKPVPCRRCVVLLYHRLTPGPARQRYEVSWVQARRHWQELAHRGAGARSLRTLWGLAGPHKPQPGQLCFALSFDDGSDSDFQAAQWLSDLGWRATFFVNASQLGKPGYLAWSQVRELAAAGFEIGSHGVDHVALTRLLRTQLEFQILASKHRLEDYLGEKIVFFAAPFGAWHSLLLETVEQYGYHGLAISRPTPAMSGAFLIPRYGIRRNMRTQQVVQLVQGGRLRVQEYVRGRGMHIWRSWRQGACAGNW